MQWAARGAELGVGEILLNSMDADGTKAGFDLELIRAVRAVVTVPIIASGGAGELAHFAPAIGAGADAVLAASVFHFGQLRIGEVKEALRGAGHPVGRPHPTAAPSPADRAAPTIPASLCIAAGTTDGPQRRQQGQELVRLAADPAADDDQVRRGEPLHMVQVLLDPPGPLAPAEVVQFLGPLRGARLRVPAADLDVAQFGVRDQDPVPEQGAADAGTERQHQHRALVPGARTEPHLGQAGRVGVVDQRHGQACRLAEQGPGVQPDPGGVQVGRGQRDPVHHDARKRDAHRPGPVEMLHVLGHHGRDRVGQRRAGRLHLDPLGEQRSPGRIDRRGLDSRAADVDPEYLHCTALRSPADPPRRGRAAARDNSMVCHRLAG